MNKKIIIILLGLAVLCICIGAIGLARRSASSSPKNNSSEASAPDMPIVGTASPHNIPDGSGIIVDPEREKHMLSVTNPKGLPSIMKDYEGFYVSFNPDNHTPNWVAWELRRDETDGSEQRQNQFWNDQDLDGCAYSSDYSRSGYDRGHMCPAADQKWSSKAMNDCFVMSNMCPQDRALNSGAWGTLENKCRLWARRDSAILIVAGPIYETSNPAKIGETGVKVPDAFFKVIADPYSSDPKGIAFVYPNMKAPGNMEQYVMTIDEVEKLTGYDFFSALPIDLQDKIESKASLKIWNRR